MFSAMRSPGHLHDHKMHGVMSWYHPWDPEREPINPNVFHIMRMRYGLTIAKLAQRGGFDKERVARFDYPRNTALVMRAAGKTFRDALQAHVILRIRERCIAQLAVIGTHADVAKLQALIEEREVQSILRRQREQQEGFDE